jgi:transcriptional regulator GlxA family with amidase domain
VVPFDLAVPCEVFARARGPGGRPGYDVRVCGNAPIVHTDYFALQTRWTLDDLQWADTVVVPGVDDLDRPVPPAVLDALRAAAARGARLASLCTGAFILAATGLLDGLAATTHWAACAELARRHATIRVDPAVLFIGAGNLFTSAGAVAALDLCLHLVRLDLGGAAAAATARLSVMPLERAGGQAQFITPAAPDGAGGSLEPLLRWIEHHLDGDLSTPTLARRASMSQRTFARRFREQAGTTPARWVTAARLRHGQLLLETTAFSIDEVAARVGFKATSTFRDAFVNAVGPNPTAWRRSFAPEPTSTPAPRQATLKPAEPPASD